MGPADLHADSKFVLLRLRGDPDTERSAHKVLWCPEGHDPGYIWQLGHEHVDPAVGYLRLHGCHCWQNRHGTVSRVPDALHHGLDV